MRRGAKLWALGLFLASVGQAADRKVTLGVFLPTTLSDGQQRFAFAEALAASLEEALGTPIAARNFGRYQEYERASNDGTLDLAVVDAWAAAEGATQGTVIALGSLGGQTALRWGLLGGSRQPVSQLGGKRLALTRGAAPDKDAKFLSHVIFGGDLPAKHFKLLPVPSVESAVKAVEVKGAELALVPLVAVPKDANILYRSAKVPGVVVLTFKGDAAAQQAALLKVTAPKPFDKFVAGKSTELADLRALMLKGPAKRLPVLAQSPVLRLDSAAVINLQQVGMVLPSFLESIELSNEQPDD